MKYIEVVAAVFKNTSNEYFCARRKDMGDLALKWEFPGGKIEAGESHQEALIREIKEELNVEIEVGKYIMTINHQYIHFHLTMHMYYAKIKKGFFTLNEHVDSIWLPKSKLHTLDWAEADLPIIDKIIKEG